MRKLSRLVVVGVGNMGEALVKGLLNQGLVETRDLIGVEELQSRAEEVARRYGITVQATAAEACQGAEAVILAVKPQDVDVAAGEIAPGIRGSLVLSVCAGITLGHLASRLPPGTPIARVMPNTPALVGCGASVYCPNEHVSEAALGITETLLGAVGAVHRVAKEELLDAVTGLSGSGPGYVFAFLEALADGGVLMGLPRPLAQALASQTLLGSAKMLEQTGEHPAELRDRVSSPAGTTIAGLRELELRGFRGAVIEAIRSATLRSRELGG